MSYYFSTTVDCSFDEAIELTTEKLSAEGFGVLSTIDVSTTLKNKLDVDMPRYTILGACNPGFAYKAILAENKIGTMLPCNVIVQETDAGIEISAVDPMESMKAIENPDLGEIATEVQALLKKVIASI